MSLMPVAEALARILGGVTPAGPESVPVEDAGGRILAENVRASRTQPPFDASAMDGYAVRAADAQHAPVTLRLIGEAAAGHPFAGGVGAEEAVRIFTGAPVPEGADGIVIQENASREGDTVTLLQAAGVGAHIRARGQDFREGDLLLRAGERLGARQVMLAAATNSAVLPVRRKPSVAVLATGDELVPPGGTLAPGQIVSSVPAGLKVAVESWGGEAALLGIARDTLDSLSQAIARAQTADILVTIGGASVGEHDLVREALTRAGMELHIWKIALRPGKPMLYGRLGPQRVLGVPGNPVSALVTACVFLKPLIDALLGRIPDNGRMELPLAAPLGPNGDRDHYMRGLISDGRVDALPDQDSSLMRLFATANCLIVRPVHAPAARAGEMVRVLPLEF